jgi:adenylosuccinate lyase
VDFKKVLNPADYIGRAPQQVDEFVRNVIAPVKRKYRNTLGRKVKLKV